MKITLLTGKTFEVENGTDLPIKAVCTSRCRRLSLRIDQKERRAVLNMPPRCSVARALQFRTALLCRRRRDSFVRRKICHPPLSGVEKRRCCRRRGAQSFRRRGFFAAAGARFYPPTGRKKTGRDDPGESGNAGAQSGADNHQRHQIALGQLLNPEQHKL